MKLGIAAFMAMPEAQRSGGAAVRAVERVARDDYFSCIDVFPIVDRGARAEAISIAREAELDVYLGAQGLLRRGDLDIGSLDPRKRREAVDAVKAAFEEACEWPAVGVVVSSGPAVEKPKREKALRALVESLTELTKAAGSMGAGKLILETFDSVPFGKNLLVGPTSMAVDLAGRVLDREKGFGLLLDLSHLPLLGEKPEEAVKAAHYALEHVHVGNCVMRHPKHPAYGDNHPPFGIREGEIGERELAAFLGALAEVKYIAEGAARTVSFEIKPLAGEAPETVFENAKETMAKAWQMI